MNVIEAEGKKIHMWGRDKEGILYHKTDDKFLPYFYVDDKTKGKFTSLFGDKVRKFYCGHPGEVKFKREQFSKHYEADITYVNRYMIDCLDNIEKEPIKVGFFDIEILGSEDVVFPSVVETKYAITCICFYDSFTKIYYTFIWHDTYDNASKMAGNNYVHYFKTEVEMLRATIKFIKDCDYDMLSAWNGERFDFPYFYNRCERMGLEVYLLGRISGSGFIQFPSGWMKTTIRGRILFDLLWAYKYLIFASRESFSLDYIGYYELKMPKLQFDGSLDKLWKENPQKLIEYNRRDVEIMVKLDEKLKVVEFFDAIRRQAKCTFNDAYSRSRVTDFLILDYCHKKEIVLPSKPKFKVKDDTYEGAYVIPPIPGLHDNVLVFDLKSLYPSIIISCNMSPETLSEDGDIRLDNGISFKSKPKGIVPLVMEKLIITRKELKQQMEKTEYGSDEYHRLYLSQFSLKVLVNSLYGALSTSFFRLFRKEISASTTYVGRQTLKWTKEFLESKSCTVLAGDTDSVLFKFKDKMEIGELVKNGESMLCMLNESYKDFAKSLNIQNPEFKIDFEKIYSKVMFVRGEKKAVKKRRAGILCWVDGKRVDDFEIVGFEARRSDVPEVTRKMQREVFKMILREGNKKGVLKLVSDAVKNIRVLPAEDIALPIGISKPIESYGNADGKHVSVHIKAVKHSNKYHGFDLKQGEKIKYIYVLRSPKGIPPTKTVAFRNRMPSGYVIDYDKMTERIITNKVKNIFNCLNWHIEEINGQSRLSDYKV